MAPQDLKPIEIALAHIRWSMEILEARMRRRAVLAPQQFLEGHELSDAGRHRIEQQKKWSVLKIGKLDLFVDDELSDFFEGCESLVDAVVTTFPGRQHTTVAKPQNDFPSEPQFPVLRTYSNAYERQVQCDVAYPSGDLSARARN